MKKQFSIGATPSQWPSDKAGVLEIATNWYDSSLVSINDEAIANLNFPPIQVGAEVGMTTGQFDASFAKNIALSVALNSINYQFWDLSPTGEFLRYDFEGVVGAQGMRNAFERAWADENSALNKARGGTPLTESDILEMFGNIPSPSTRVQVLNEILLPPRLEQVCDELAKMIEQGKRIDTPLATLLADAFPLAYGDPVLKKAQLALSEVWVKEEKSGVALQCDLTAFADYQIPNILRAMGVLEYSDELAQQIDQYKEIPYRSIEECAIRGASLLAVEKIAAQEGVPVAAVDHYLWTRRKEAATPFHLTATTAY